MFKVITISQYTQQINIKYSNKISLQEYFEKNQMIWKIST